MRLLPQHPAALAGAALLAMALAGCGGGPSAEEVQREHRDEATAAQQGIEAALAPLEQTGEALATATRDSCETGQHNYKVDDPYDVRCTLEVHQAYRVTGADFRAAADSVTAAFPECADSEAEETLSEYWDELKGTRTHNFEGPYIPDYLPSYRLDCEDAPVRITVTGWATLPSDSDTFERHEHAMGMPCASSTEDRPCQWDGTSARTIFGFDAAGQDGWIVFVEGTQAYAEIG
ncbi:hypothetical protein [Ornithinimicrobium murale]|uniref:hypothetical protein n=1 Tax=Ornithinimicrobium murale TaxID=1050153 RepID=UPI000E0D420C|nr:hypothetical protein [Ornithinimicrobium murale]